MDDASFFNIKESITYTYDFDHYIGPSSNPRWRPNPRAVGYIGYAFLESPGNPYDGIDNLRPESTAAVSAGMSAGTAAFSSLLLEERNWIL